MAKRKKKKVVKKKEKEVQIDNVRPITKEVINKSQALKEFEPIKDDSDIESIDESIVEDVEDDYVMYADDYDEIDESEYVEAVAHRLAETLRNPFADTYDYEWYPICQALEAIGISDERGLKKIEGASNGQRLVFAFYALGNDGPLPWAWANYCID